MKRQRRTSSEAQWPASFQPADTQLFNKHHIPAELVVAAQIRRVKDTEARRAGIGHNLDGDMSGLLFPYCDPLTEKQITHRLRRDKPETNEKGEQQRKYMMPTRSANRRILYYPPNARNLLENRCTQFVLVEAEKSALAITAWARRKQRAHLLPIALGGCWGWSQDKQPLADFEMFEGRTVAILLDANLTTNPQVRLAHDELVSALYARGCAVYTLAMPQIEGVNGPDDLLAQLNGDELLDEVLSGGQKATIAPYSDDALAGRFASEQKDNLRYVRQWDQWLLWDESHWKDDVVQETSRRVQDFCHAAALHCGKLAEARRIRSARTREAVQREASVKQPLVATAEMWDADPWLLSTPHGVVDLHSGQPRPANRTDYCTKKVATTSSGKRPARWLQFLREVTGNDKSLQAYLQRMAGYCLTGSTREHAMFFLYGTGANGKSVFVNTLQGVLGNYAKVAAMDMFMAAHNPQHSTDLAGLRGARLVIASETEDGSRWAESKIKAITGGEPISARFMRQDFFEYTPQFKLLISGNHRPRLRNVDEAMRRRMHLIPFSVTIPRAERDPKLGEDLKQEWPGVLQWAIDGCLSWQRDGLNPPMAVSEATKEYLEEQDVIGQWLDEATEKDRNARTAPNELYQAYRRWAEGRGEYVCAQKEFSQKLAERDITSKKSNGIRYVALRLKQFGERKFERKGAPLRN